MNLLDAAKTPFKAIFKGVEAPIANLPTMANTVASGDFVVLYDINGGAGKYIVKTTIAQLAAAVAATGEVDTILTGITATAGGGQGTAADLTGDFNEITTCATAGDSVKLPTAAEGLVVTVKNNGATAADVFPNTSDSINTLAVNTAIRLAPGCTKTFRAISAVIWESTEEKVAVVDGVVGAPGYSFNTQPDMGLYKVSATQLGIAISGALSAMVDDNGLVTGEINEQVVGAGVRVQHSITTGITAFATGGQANAVELTTRFNVVGTVATGGDSVKIESQADTGIAYSIKNAGANACDVFPPSGGDIGAGANTAISLAAGATITYVSTAADTFIAV